MRWPLPSHPDLRGRLLAAYADPARGYHDTTHLTEVLARIEELLSAHPVADPDAVRLAAWFHDAVYEGAPGADEEASAVLAEEMLAALVDPATVAETARLVRLTASHTPAEDDLPGQVLVDADLAILAAAPERYLDYRRGVRRDYAHVPDQDFIRGRSQVLADLLARPQLFHTPTARTWEPAARANLADELGALAIVRHWETGENGPVEFVDVDGFTPGQPDVVDVDPGWVSAYAELESRVRTALGPLVLAVEHVGSTSVPLPAKPVIDVDLVVPDPTDEAAYAQPLRDAGFLFVLREPGWHQHRVFRGTDPAANVHVFGPDSPEVVRHRLFRDHLRVHAEDRELYAAAKLAAADATGADEDVMDYNRRKQEVVRSIYDRIFRADPRLGAALNASAPARASR